MGGDYLQGVLASCRVTGMLARLDLGEQYGNAPVLLGTAGDLRAWESFGPGKAFGLLRRDVDDRQKGGDHDRTEHGDGGWCVITVVADTTSVSA